MQFMLTGTLCSKAKGQGAGGLIGLQRELFYGEVLISAKNAGDSDWGPEIEVHLVLDAMRTRYLKLI